MLPGWVAWAGGRAFPPVRVLGGLDELVDTIDDANSDVIVVTGATSTSDDVHRAVARLSGRWVVDGVAVRPGTASSLAVLPDGRRVVSLPEAPLGAVAGVLTLLVPLLAVLRGELGADESRTEECVLATDLPPGLVDSEGYVRLVPVQRRRTSLVPSATPLPHDGPRCLARDRAGGRHRGRRARCGGARHRRHRPPAAVTGTCRTPLAEPSLTTKITSTGQIAQFNCRDRP